MILADMSNIAISAIQEACSGNKETLVLDETSIRHIILKKLMDIHKKIGKHHELILCFDSRNYWRKDYFEFYKGTRKKIDSGFSWDEFYRLYTDFKIEIPLFFNYKCIEVDRCEADDIIYCISEYVKGRNVVIASSDTDDLQILEKFPEAAQYSLKNKKMITCKDYNYSLLDHIIEGDTGDGIPSILNEADCLMKGIRQKPLTKQRRASLKFIIPDEYEARFEQNKKIIDMSMIDDNYRQQIIEKYLEEKPKRIGNPFQYCIKYKLGLLLKHLS